MAQNVSAAIHDAGASVETVAEATGIPCSELNAHLRGESPFTLDELGSVGGFLRLSPAVFLKGAA